jgi:pimeloyl-ACP methyl ester carboxylesterase
MSPVVLVHGNPETAAVWGPLISQLERPSVTTLSPPGFGAPAPAAFSATADAYLDWLVDALEDLAEPVDLVGHDWGGGHAIRVAMERPDLIRSWAMDIAGCLAPDYIWHDMAQVWQTPGRGEEAIAAMIGLPVPQRAEGFQSLGITAPVAQQLAEATDETMGRCILALYRSAAQPRMARLGEHLGMAARRPGLVIIPTDDGYTGGEHRARWAAERAGAAVAVLPGRGHWWMLEDPHSGARALEDFWSRLD